MAKSFLRSLFLCGLAVLVLGGAGLNDALAGSKKKASKKDAKSVMVERGRYLVSTIGACNDCHTPWKFNKEFNMPEPDMTRMLSGHPAGAPDPASEYKGHDMAIIGPTFTSFRMPFGVVYTANLTPDKKTGLGEWNEKMFLDALRKGTHMGADGRIILPPMP